MAQLAAAQPKTARKSGPAPIRAPALRASGPYGLPIQARMAVGPTQGRFEAEADRAAAHVISGRAGVPTITPLSSGAAAGPSVPASSPGAPALAVSDASVQRKCTRCEDQDNSPGLTIMRKCACGAASGPECTCNKDEDSALTVNRHASAPGHAEHDDLGHVARVIGGSGRPLEPRVRDDMEQRFGHSFEQVRIHNDPAAAASARAISAHAYTVGNHIAFGQGRYHPGTSGGRFLLAHELAHTIQQSGGSGLRPKSGVSRPHDTHERQADRAASAALGAQPMPMLSPSATQISRYSFDEFLGDVGSVVGAGVDTVTEGAERAWDQATAIADAVGSAVSFSGGKLTVTVPEFSPCPEFDFQFALSEFGLAPSMFVPIVTGVLPVSGVVNLYGSMGVNLTLDPEIGVQLVDCSIGPSTITVDPFSASTSLSTDYSVTGALSLGATFDLAARGEVGVLIIIPNPPIPLMIPVAGLEIGGSAQVRGIGGGTISNNLSLSVGLGGVSQSSSLDAELGLAADLGVGAYGSIDVLGQTICRLNWPLYEWHGDTTAKLGLDLDLDISTSGLDASISVSAGTLSQSPFETLPLAFDRSVLEDDCPLCQALYDLGLMPSQNGGSWHGHPAPELGGPLLVYPKDPGIASGALCRGVCGVDCAEGSCSEPEDKYVCEETGDGHVWRVYASYIECGTAQGCRDHDSCYDWAAAQGEGGLAGVIFGPIHRLCDFECLCNYGAPTCVGWATANGPYDGIMNFAEYAYTLPGCRGPCPQEAEGEEEGSTVQQTCLPEIELLKMRSFSDRWDRHYGPVRLYTQFFEVPYIVGVWVGVDAYADAAAMAFAKLGPVTLSDVCLNYDPATGEYHGGGSLVAGLNVGGGISLTGSIDAWASDFLCLFRVVGMEGGLNARANAAWPSTVSYDVNMVCRNGELWVDHGVDLETCLKLSFDLDAFFNLDIFSINLIEERWNLDHREWEDCWQMAINFKPILVGQAPEISFDSNLLRVFELIQWLFGEAGRDRDRDIHDIGPDPAREKGLLNPCGDDDDDDGPPQPQPTCTQVVEDPVTSATAHTLGAIAGQIDETNWETELFSLPTGGSDTVGVAMESAFLTDQHAPGSNSTGSAQTDIYRFRKLPTRGAFGGSPGTGGARRVYIKGHLLNANIGGPADDENLYPITGYANNPDHSNNVESHVKSLVLNQHLLVYYRVDVVNRSAPQPIDVFGDGTCTYYYAAAAFDCTWATYKLCNDQILERNPETNRVISSTFDLGGFITGVAGKGCPER